MRQSAEVHWLQVCMHGNFGCSSAQSVVLLKVMDELAPDQILAHFFIGRRVFGDDLLWCNDGFCGCYCGLHVPIILKLICLILDYPL